MPTNAVVRKFLPKINGPKVGLSNKNKVCEKHSIEQKVQLIQYVVFPKNFINVPDLAPCFFSVEENDSDFGIRTFLIHKIYCKCLIFGNDTPLLGNMDVSN